MSYLMEKVSYLKGLADGLELEADTKETKLILEIINVLSDLSETVEELDEEVGEIDEYLEMVDEDLSDLEEFVYEEYDFDEDFEEVICPHCGETIYTDEYLDFDTEITCPICEKTFVVGNDEE